MYTVQVYLTHKWDIIRCYHSGPKWTRKRWQWMDTYHSSKPQHFWNLTIRLFSTIYGTLIWRGSYASAEEQLLYSKAPADWVNKCLVGNVLNKHISVFTHRQIVQVFLGNTNSIFAHSSSFSSISKTFTIPFVGAQLKKQSGVMVIVVGNGHGVMSSNTGRRWSHFT